MSSADILEQIVAHKRGEIAAAKSARPEVTLQAQLADCGPTRDFVQALQTARSALGIGLIAEIKRASPSAGLIRPDFDLVSIAEAYVANGAACLSVLTDERYFQGQLGYLAQVRNAVAVPLLRKDFIVDRYQVLEARVAGADCILLIAECLDDCALRDLYFYASELDLAVLIEIHDAENLDRVLKLEPELLGINNRDLRVMKTDLEHTLGLLERIPRETLVVSESGIKTHADVARLIAAGVGGILVGESLMRQPDIGHATAALLGRPTA